AAARQKARVADALDALAAPYVSATKYYAARFPGLEPSRTFVLALTDTMWRAFFETMRDVARSTGAWVVAATTASDAIAESNAADDVAALRDPDAPAPTVYVARDPRVYQATYFMSPEGRIVAKVRTAYAAADELLAGDAAPLASAEPVDLGFAKVGALLGR